MRFRSSNVDAFRSAHSVSAVESCIAQRLCSVGLGLDGGFCQPSLRVEGERFRERSVLALTRPLRPTRRTLHLIFMQPLRRAAQDSRYA